jgi:hypothetical protein
LTLAATHGLLALKSERALRNASLCFTTATTFQQVHSLNLFKFTEELQARLETLLEKHKNQTLNEAETSEFAGITELDRVFTLMNARIIAGLA